MTENSTPSLMEWRNDRSTTGSLAKAGLLARSRGKQRDTG